MAQNQVVAASYRRTAYGGLTIPVGIRRVAGSIEIARPLYRRFSRSGAHGTFYFVGVDAIVFLDQTNSGHRGVFVRCISGDAGFCDAQRRCARQLWIVHRLDAWDVIASLPSCRL